MADSSRRFHAGTTSGLTDAQLLERFISGRDDTKEAAFESLVLRHGPMVFDICHKIMGNTHDAQDAFQATFLILATKSRSIMRQGSVGGWLHGVALRVTHRARVDAARRTVQERQIAELKRWEIEPHTMHNGHDFEVLHDEVERLPRKYREAVILCYLEGMSLEAAAGQLGCPIGTLGVRLMREGTLENPADAPRDVGTGGLSLADYPRSQPQLRCPRRSSAQR